MDEKRQVEKRHGMKYLAIAIAFLMVATTAQAADVDGKWSGTIDTPTGSYEQVFTFKADGSKLTGALSLTGGMETPISNGKIDGDNISFSVSLNYGQMPFTVAYTGVVSGDEIKLSGEAGGGYRIDFAVKKVK
jgi:hypothetical protein